MPTLIKDGQVVDNPWSLLAKDVDLSTALSDQSSHIIVPFALWQEHKDSLMESGKAVAVWVDSDDDPYELANDVIDLPLICLNFPVFRDGRAFSAAAILRERLNYQGEIRAIGEFIRDQLFLMQRCGFSQFSFANDIDLQAAADSLKDFSEVYQTAADQPQPLFKRLR